MSKLIYVRPRIHESKLNSRFQVLQIRTFKFSMLLFIRENEEKIMDLFNLLVKQVKILIVIK